MSIDHVKLTADLRAALHIAKAVVPQVVEEIGRRLMEVS